MIVVVPQVEVHEQSRAVYVARCGGLARSPLAEPVCPSRSLTLTRCGVRCGSCDGVLMRCRIEAIGYGFVRTATRSMVTTNFTLNSHNTR